jgi:hypothetical protein
MEIKQKALLCSTKGTSLTYNAELKKPDMKEFLFYYSIYMKFKNSQIYIRTRLPLARGIMGKRNEGASYWVLDCLYFI